MAMEKERIVVTRTPLAVYPLNLLGVSEGINLGYVGHMDELEEWKPYKIGDLARDIEEHARKLLKAGVANPTRFAKFVNTEWSKDINNYLHRGEGLLFLLGDGLFPIGCGARDWCAIIAVRPGAYTAADIGRKIFEDSGVDVKHRATGILRLENNVLRIDGFSTSWWDGLEDYADVIRALARSDIALNGTPIIFQATFK